MRSGQVRVVGAVLAMWTLAGCNSEPEPGTSPRAAARNVATPQYAEPLKGPAAEKAYLTALAEVDKRLAADDDALVYGENICLDIKQEKPAATVEKNAAARFEVDAATAKEIVAVAKGSLCEK